MADCDYMSDDIIAQCTDVRPGLLHNKKLQREHSLHKKAIENRKKNRPLKEIEKEQLKRGLETALGEDNKGFKMLRKMGYTAGGLGKHEDGVTTPVSIKIKSDTSGLGRNVIPKPEKCEENTSLNMEEYRATLKEKDDVKNLKYDYEKSRRTCLFFDSKANVTKPMQDWFWPKEENTDSETSSDDETSERSKIITTVEMFERLNELTAYLRNSYNYCLWCAVSYDDEQDLRQECPGPTRQLHTEDTKVELTSSNDERC